MKQYNLISNTYPYQMKWALILPIFFFAISFHITKIGAMEDVMIQGEAMDEIPLTKDDPPTEMSLDEIASLSRVGQTDRVLEGPVHHMTSQEASQLLRLTSTQTQWPVPVKIPSSPFFQVEVPPAVQSGSWALEILDQNNKLLHKVEGAVLPKNYVEWDGYQDGQFKVQVGPAYTPMLIVTDDNGGRQRYFGQPLRLDAVQYMQKDILNVELSNDRLFRKGRADFSNEAMPLLMAALNTMRQQFNGTFRIIHYAPPKSSDLGNQRLEILKSFFQEELVVDGKKLSVVVSPPQLRGEVTTILMPKASPSQ